MTAHEQVEAAVKAALANREDGVSLDAAIAGQLNEQGWIVKQCTVLKWADGSHTVAVSNDGQTITIHVKG